MVTSRAVSFAPIPVGDDEVEKELVKLSPEG
jgi:hypothetical protein